MNREAWAMFLGLAVVTAVGVLGFVTWTKQQELLHARAALQDAQRAAEQKAAHLAEANHALGLERSRAEALLRDFSVVTNTQHRLESEMRAALESRDIAISELQGKLTVTIVDRILFDSGDATVKPEGMQVLDQVAKVLARFSNRQVQVFGHTDNVPIRVRFPSNWELSTARAVAAVRYLTEKAGVEPKRLSAVGCGEFQPIADNATAEGRAKNRRIALVVLPEQFVPTDVAPGSTNALPVPGPTETPGNGTPLPSPGVSTNVPPAEGATNAITPAAETSLIPTTPEATSNADTNTPADTGVNLPLAPRRDGITP